MLKSNNVFSNTIKVTVLSAVLMIDVLPTAHADQLIISAPFGRSLSEEEFVRIRQNNYTGTDEYHYKFEANNNGIVWGFDSTLGNDLEIVLFGISD